MLRSAWIKGHWGTLSVLLIVIGILGYLAVAVHENGPLFFHDSQLEVNQTLKSFQHKHSPLVEINFSALYGESSQFEVLHPLLDLRRLRFREQNPSCSNEDNLPTKLLPRVKIIQPSGMYDSAEWQQTKRGQLEHFLSEGTPLSEDFLTTPPFVDELGSSFAYLLVQNRPSLYNNRHWIERHLSFFKISELTEVLRRQSIDNLKFSILSHFNESEIEEVIRGAPLVLTKDYLLLRNQARLGFSPLSYWVYKLQNLRSELKNGKYELTNLLPNSVCLQKMGNACWTYNSTQTMAYLSRYSAGILVLVALIILIIFGLYLKHLFQKSKEQQKHRLALQVLSHEFRTPVTSMLLMMSNWLRIIPN